MNERTEGQAGLDNVRALLELCDAQQASIDRLHRALQEHEGIERDRVTLKRMLAHELRTPLAAIVATLHTLSLPSLPPEKNEDMRLRALRQAEHLAEMVEDVLHLADPHEAAVRRAPQQWVDVAEIVDEVALLVETEPGVTTLAVDVPAEVALHTVPGRVRQILVNLVVNAAKYGPPDGVVEIAAERLADAVRFEVRDRGPGIPVEAVEALFRPFRRGARAAGTAGLGLGLYLVRNLVRSLGGTIDLLPRAGGGTVACFTLPQQRLDDAVGPATAHREVAAGRTQDA